MPLKVLIVEDEPAIQELIAYTCRTSGMETLRVGTVSEARLFLHEANPDLVLLDWMLPDCSGLQWLREIRANVSTQKLPVILLTAKGQEDDKVAGLEAGADDYIVKPFSPRELVARIKTVARRNQKNDDTKEEITVCGPLTINSTRFEATVNGQPLKLSVSEFNLLHVFAKRPGRVYSRQQLIDSVWGLQADIDERTVDVHMLRLRKQLSGTPIENFIETVRGIGYRGANLS